MLKHFNSKKEKLLYSGLHTIYYITKNIFNISICPSENIFISKFKNISYLMIRVLYNTNNDDINTKIMVEKLVYELEYDNELYGMYIKNLLLSIFSSVDDRIINILN